MLRFWKLMLTLTPMLMVTLVLIMVLTMVLRVVLITTSALTCNSMSLQQHSTILSPQHRKMKSLYKELLSRVKSPAGQDYLSRIQRETATQAR